MAALRTSTKSAFVRLVFGFIESIIGKDFVSQYLNRLVQRHTGYHSVFQFYVLAKCTSKLDYLINEMLFIHKLKPELNVQTDSIRAKVFV